mgnify:CR=1 FL=1
MKKNFVMLLVAFLSVAGLAACSDDERDDATSMAVSGWYGSYVVTIAFFFMVGLTACSNEGGDWEPMDWKTDGEETFRIRADGRRYLPVLLQELQFLVLRPTRIWGKRRA